MLTPCWPNAGPTGGAGVAWPPGDLSFTFAVITFALVRPFVFASRGVVRQGAAVFLVRLQLDVVGAGVLLARDALFFVVGILGVLLRGHDDRAKIAGGALVLDPPLQGVADRVLAAALDFQDVPG